MMASIIMMICTLLADKPIASFKAYKFLYLQCVFVECAECPNTIITGSRSLHKKHSTHLKASLQIVGKLHMQRSNS